MLLISRDSGSVMVLTQRVRQAAAGVVTLAFVARFLSPVEQGYFHTLARETLINSVLPAKAEIQQLEN